MRLNDKHVAHEHIKIIMNKKLRWTIWRVSCLQFVVSTVGFLWVEVRGVNVDALLHLPVRAPVRGHSSHDFHLAKEETWLINQGYLRRNLIKKSIISIRGVIRQFLQNSWFWIFMKDTLLWSIRYKYLKSEAIPIIHCHIRMVFI